MRGPSPLAALLVCVGVVGGRLALVGASQLVFLAMVLALVALGVPFRRRVVSVCVGLAFACLLVGAVCVGRVVGGVGRDLAIGDAVNTLALAMSLWLAATVLLGSVPLALALHWADGLRVPRTASYVPLAGLATLSSVRGLGERQVRLLRLKGLEGHGVLDRARAYYRVSGPLFNVLMSRQLRHVRSLEDRGFFERGGRAAANTPSLAAADVVWLGGISVAFLVAQIVSAR